MFGNVKVMSNCKDNLNLIRAKLFARKLLLFLCVALLVFVGGAFLWKYCLVEAYGVWKPVLEFLISIPVGWWLLLVVIGTVIKGLRYRFGEEDRNLNNQDKTLIVPSDAPIKTAEEDRLARDAYVRMLSTLIMSSPQTHDARYVGVYGAWGDGKTSVRFLLEERIRVDYGEKGAIIVEFSPWEYPEPIDVRMIFFERLATTVAKCGYEELAKVSSSLAKHFKMSRLSQNVGPINDCVDWIWKLFSCASLPDEVLTAALRKLLGAMTQKIIVVVDDLDRLSKEETCRVIRFLKANGDLPNITYLILADENYLANAVASLVARSDRPDIECGREYLKKIIPLRCPLPSINGNRLLTIFKQGLTRILTCYGLEGDNPNESCDWLLLPYLENARIGKLILNSFSIKLATYKRVVGGRKYLGVHIGDLLALTVMEICEPDLYANLGEGYMGLLHDSWRYYGSDKGLPAQWMEEHFFKHTTKRDLTERFLKEYLGVTCNGGGPYDKEPLKYKLGNPQAPELMLNYRLASATSFPHYFLCEEEPGRLSQSDVEGFLGEVKAGRIPENVIRRLDESGMLPYLLYALEAEKMFSTEQISDCYIKTLIHMADMPLRNISLPGEYQNWFVPQPIYVGVYRCLLFYCKDIRTHIMSDEKIYGKKVKRIGELLLPLLRNNFDVVLTAHLIGHDKEYHGDKASASSYYDALFSHEEYEELRRMFLDRIEQFQRDGRLVGHVEFDSLFRRWRMLLREYADDKLNDRFKTACLSMTHDVQAINQMIRFFIEDNGLTDIHSELIIAIRLDELTASFGENGVASIIATLESAVQVPIYTYKALVAVRWALEQKATKNPYGTEDQMARLKELYESEPIKAEMSAKVATDELRQ